MCEIHPDVCQSIGKWLLEFTITTEHYHVMINYDVNRLHAYPWCSLCYGESVFLRCQDSLEMPRKGIETRLMG